MASVKPIPEGSHSIIPIMNVRGAEAALSFLQGALEGTLLARFDRPDGGGIMHAQVRIGDSTVMVSEACDQMGPMPSSLYLYVDDVDATYQAALRAGATSNAEPADMFWGDRMAAVQDPVGNMWCIATHVEDVAPQEIARRAKEQAGQAQSPKA